ncbi:MAG: hypothetical protein H8E55_67015, partial [Pelagibacterales bacterium]|nr:hypothetical protein [Pelagibacterales bacterium]
QKNLYNFDINFKWKPLEFNTNPNAKNPYANFGPTPTTNTTTNNDNKTYTEFVTDTSVIYIETTPTVTIIRTVDKATYKVTIKSYSKGSIIPEIQGIQTNSVEREGVNVLADNINTDYIANTPTTYNPPTTTDTTY